jgi:hypothetical protein
MASELFLLTVKGNFSSLAAGIDERELSEITDYGRRTDRQPLREED